MNCRHCAEPLSFVMADLGICPLANAYLDPGQLPAQEKAYPLKVLVCGKCWLVQTADFVERGECFSDDYAYLAPVRQVGWPMRGVMRNKWLPAGSLAQEAWLLRLPRTTGICSSTLSRRKSPAMESNPLRAPRQWQEAGALRSFRSFSAGSLRSSFGSSGARWIWSWPITCWRTCRISTTSRRGLSCFLAPGGIATFEFPHLLRLIEENYFDTIYHEHYSYLSLHAVQKIFSRAGLQVFDLEELPTHGGSLRVFAGRKAEAPAPSSALLDFAAREREAGLREWRGYRQFQKNMESVRDGFLGFLNSAKEAGHSLAAYGAAAKGNTLLNFSGVDTRSLPFVVDRSPAKVGRVLPGSRIPIYDEEKLRAEKPDYILILPWNLETEITGQLSYASAWGAQFVVASPKIRIWAA